MIVYGGYLTYEYFIKGTEKNDRNQLSGKYGTFIGINVLYILITLVASNLMDWCLELIHPEPADCYFSTVEHLASAYCGLLSVDLYSLADPVGIEYRSVKDRS